MQAFEEVAGVIERYKKEKRQLQAQQSEFDEAENDLAILLRANGGVFRFGATVYLLTGCNDRVASRLVANANLVPTRELVLPPLLQPGATRPDPAEESYLADARRYCPRLAYDYAVSKDSPIIRGTQITAASIVNLVVDGSSWSDILRDNPELDEDDVRSCLWYAVVSDGPFVPGIEIVNDDEAKGVPVKPKPAPPEAAGQPKPADDWDSFGIDGTAVNAGPSTLGPAPAKASEPPPPQPMLLEEDVEPAIDHPMIAGGSPDADDPRNALGPNPFLGLRRQRP